MTMTRGAAIGGAFAAATAAQIAPAGAQADAMKALVAAAKAEGSVVIDGPPVDLVRELFTQGMQKEYGISVSYIPSENSTSGARVRAERTAGKYLLDVLVAGGDTPTATYLPSGWLDKIEPILVAPDVIDPRKWKDGHLWWEEPSHTILRTLSFVTPEIAINTKVVKPGEITKWKDLLDPKWQGKIIAKDPGTSGAGTSLIAMLYLTFGPDFVKKLYQGQKPVISRNGRQAMGFLAQGGYAALLGPEATAMAQYQRQGYPVAPAFPTDGPSILSGGYGLISLVNKAPHPNAAKLFINWFAGPGPQKAFAEAVQSVSLRNDIRYENLPPWVFPQKGTKYLDSYGWDFVNAQREPAQAKARELLGE
jgi:iron(III) transport system substrate-binding protein